MDFKKQYLYCDDGLLYFISNYLENIIINIKHQKQCTY